MMDTARMPRLMLVHFAVQTQSINTHPHTDSVQMSVCSLWALVKKSWCSSAAEEISHSSNAAIFWATLNTHPHRGPDLLSLSTLEIRSAREQENRKYGQRKRKCMPLATRVVARMPLFFVWFCFVSVFVCFFVWCFDWFGLVLFVFLFWCFSKLLCRIRLHETV